MKLDQIRVENFRSYDRMTDWIEVDEKLLIVGKNNAGKSNLLRAVDMVLDVSPTSPHEVADAHLENTEDDIIVECWFSNLTESARETFADYCDDGRLWLRVEFPFDSEREAPENKRFVVREQKPTIEAFRGREDFNADEAEEVYRDHQDTLEPYRIDDWSGNLYKKDILPTIGNYLKSDEAEFEGVKVINPSGIKKRLRRELPEFRYFEADRSIEDETKTSRNALLGQLLENTVASVSEDQKDTIKEALSDVDEKLNSQKRFDEIGELETEICKKLNRQIPVDDLRIKIDVPDLESVLDNVTVMINDGVETDIDRMGAGVHTSFILAGLWQLAAQDEKTQGNVIFGLEEPENDLHPHAQRQLNDTVDRLTEQGYQVMMSTHSAFLVNADDAFDTVRVDKQGTASEVYAPDRSNFDEADIRDIERRMITENNEILFSRAVLVGEGESEAAVLPILTSLLHEQREEVYALDRLGVSLIEVGSKGTFENFLSLSNAFGIPSVVVMDDDADVDDGHENLRGIAESQADSVIELPNDLEEQLFEAVTLEDFCEVLRDLDEYKKDPEDLRKAVEGSGKPEKTIMREAFEEKDPSKPEFGRALAERLSSQDIPEGIVEVAEQCREAAHR